MQLKFFAIAAALTGAATAQLENLPSSVLNVLITAIPPDVIQSFNSNPTQVFNDIASSVSAGTPPPWYQSLPTDVQSALNSFAAGQAPSAPTVTPTDAASVISSIGASISSSISAEISSGVESALSSMSEDMSASSGSMQSTMTSMSEEEDSSSTATDASATDASATDATSTGGAAIPTAVIGAGVAGLVGLVGVLAL